MSDIAIQIEGLGKKYTLRHERAGYKTFRETLVSGAQAIARRIRHPFSTRSSEDAEEFWALQDVNLEIRQGECIGIIGRNGAGKSTLLKILSRITEPTTGRVIINGRVASLLEVGTGFHPELTGRENIYLNGAILGMRRSEIKRKFDEIVDFSGVEKFIDTPVKRYSSGMYVRLAFAVAAHLEPEILIVDEVLAVGDAEFQKKCMGKMEDVSTREGRTVLFVSHNMLAITSLCDKGVLLSQGVVEFAGESRQLVNYYTGSQNTNSLVQSWSEVNAPRSARVMLTSLVISNDPAHNTSIIDMDLPVYIIFKFRFLDKSAHKDALYNVSLVISTSDGSPIFNVYSKSSKIDGDVMRGQCKLSSGLLNSIQYSVRLLVVENETNAIFDVSNLAFFEPVETNRQSAWHGKLIGVMHPRHHASWIINGERL
jgi:lipopolysaccharide transport system ATP-binding protein